MSNEFEPYPSDGKNHEFCVWELKTPQEESVPVVNQEEEFLKQCELLKQEAIAQGYAEGMQKAQVEIDEKKAELSQWIAFFHHPIHLLDEQLTQEIIQTVIWLCQHCIGVELTVHPDKLQDLFIQIKEELPSLKNNKVLAMNPSDVDWIKAEINEKEIPGINEALFADPELNRGDFYLKSEQGHLDGRLQIRLSTLFAKYLNKETLITPLKPQD